MRTRLLLLIAVAAVAAGLSARPAWRFYVRYYRDNSTVVPRTSIDWVVYWHVSAKPDVTEVLAIETRRSDSFAGEIARVRFLAAGTEREAFYLVEDYRVVRDATREEWDGW